LLAHCRPWATTGTRTGAPPTATTIPHTRHSAATACRASYREMPTVRQLVRSQSGETGQTAPPHAEKEPGMPVSETLKNVVFAEGNQNFDGVDVSLWLLHQSYIGEHMFVNPLTN
jgi:hypothetical protein